MLTFKCLNCQHDINIDKQYMGDMIQCPFCSSLQIVPDQILPDGSHFEGVPIVRTIATSILWTVYEIAQKPHNLALCIPTSFFLKRVSNLQDFAERVATSGALNIPEIPTLLKHSINPGNEFFIFDYQPNTYKISSFISANPINPYTALQTVKNVAQCLSQVWEQYGMLHQCLIPENINMSNDCSVRIENIGLSEFLLHDLPLLEQGFNIWDYHFMSPEFMNEGIANSPACDIYSLGGILFYMCSGHYPFENIPPESVAAYSAPSLKAYIPEIPENIEILIQMMMATNPASRLNSWHEVIKQIDIILANQPVITEAPNLPVESHAQQQDYNQAVGLSAGDLTQTIKKDKAMANSHGGSPENIKPVSKNNLSTMNKKWSKKKALKPKKGHHKKQKALAHKNPHHKHKTHEKSPTLSVKKKEDPTAMIITLSLAALVAIIVVVVIIVNSGNKEKKTTRRQTVSNTPVTNTNQSHLQTFATADEKQRQLLLSQGIDVSKLNPNAKKTTNDDSVIERTKVKVKKTKPSIKKTKVSAFKSRVLAVDAYLQDNPSQAGEAMRRYEKLMEEARLARNFPMIDLIQGKIDSLPDGTVAASGPDPEIEAVLQKIKQQILPLLKAEKYDEALSTLLEYDGELAEESKSERVALSKEIKARIANIDSDDSNTVEEAPETNSPQNPSDVLKKIAQLIAPKLMKGDANTAKAQVDTALATANDEKVKTVLTAWSKQIADYEKLKPNLESLDSAESVIKNEENNTMMENADLLKALLYKNKDEFLQAKQSFQKLPYSLGNVFVLAMEQSLNE